MKPRGDTDASGTEQASGHRRGVRVFVALHLAAVGIIYAIAVTVGGGFAGPPMPPITVAMASPPAAPATRAPTPPMAQPTTPHHAPAPLPDWTRRAEIPAPWESR